MSGPNNLLFKDLPITLASSVPQLVLGWNNVRFYLAIQNTGIGGLTISYGSSTGARVGTGPSLDPAPTAGGQGGSWEFSVVVP